MKTQSYATYLLLDTALMDAFDNAPWLKDRRCRGWMERIYDKREAMVSPVLIDIDATYRCGRIDEMMGFVAACKPKFHVSIIDTRLSLEDMANHFRQLTFFWSDENEQFTLRFADSTVLLALSAVLTGDQWKSFHGQINRWRVHTRDDNLVTLPEPLSETADPLPLLLGKSQIFQLKEEMAVYQFMANSQKFRSCRKTVLTFARKYEWAREARGIWLESKQTDKAVLALFLAGVFDSNGRLLRAPALPRILSDADVNRARKNLRLAIADHMG